MEEDQKWRQRLDALADVLLEKLERAAEELDMAVVNHQEKVKTGDGEHTLKYDTVQQTRGIVDRGGLKQLTGVLRDLEDVLLHQSEADAREREARIAKLQRDLEKETDLGNRVTVRLEGEMKDYAD